MRKSCNKSKYIAQTQTKLSNSLCHDAEDINLNTSNCSKEQAACSLIFKSKKFCHQRNLLPYEIKDIVASRTCYPDSERNSHSFLFNRANFVNTANKGCDVQSKF
jgi:hypothetical protein